MPLIIRQSKPDDIGSLTGLLKELCTIEEDFNFNENKQSKGIALLLASNASCVMVAEHDAKIIGMCTIQTLISTAEGGKVGIIEDVVVQQAYVCKGMGRKLLSAIEQWALAQGLTRLQLLADRNNQHGLTFYDKLGWQQTQLIGLRKLIS